MDRAKIQRVGNLHVEDVIFSDQARAEAVGSSDVLHQPCGCFQGFAGTIAGIPTQAGALVLDFGGIELEDLVTGDIDKQQSGVHLEQEAILFFVRLVEVPLTHGVIVHAQNRLLGGFPVERFAPRHGGAANGGNDCHSKQNRE